MFLLVLPLYYHVKREEREERLRALGTHGLKLPGAIDTAINAMVEATQHIVAALAGGCVSNFVGSAREELFHAICALNNSRLGINESYFRITVLGALCSMSQSPEQTAAAPSAAIAMSTTILQDRHLMEAPVAALPISAGDLRNTYGLQGKAIGDAAAAVRLYCLHHPAASKEEILAHLHADSLLPSMSI
jgi:hypothetical protein